MTEHEHIWHGVGTQVVSLMRKDWKSDIIPPDTTINTIVRACDCGDWYLQPLEGRDLKDVLRPWPEWASDD